MTNLELLELSQTWKGRTISGKKINLETGIKYFGVGELIAVFGTWAVTFYGVECLIFDYPISKKQIDNETRQNWIEHMGRKYWVNVSDFTEAFDLANQLFNKPEKKDRQLLREINLRIRFKVFRRDGFRCRICGISADEGARLEVDHFEAASQGGADDLKNFWTLCFECNRGKSNLSMQE